jgi:hypothetical protein
MRTRVVASVLLVVLSGVVAAQTPAASKAVMDARKACQVSVPADWTVQSSSATSADKKSTANVQALRADQTFDEGKTRAKANMPVVKVVEDSAKRLMYVGDPGAKSPGLTGWYVVANTTPVCTVAFTFAKGADEAAARKVADSLAPVK